MTKREARIEALRIAYTLIERSVHQGGMPLEDEKIRTELDKILDSLDRQADRLEKND